MSRILVVYGSSYGQTRKVVDRLAQGLTVRGHQVTIWKGDVTPAVPALERFDAFLIAGSVRYGKHQRYLTNFARDHSARLNTFPSAFVSVCGAMAGTSVQGQAEARKYVERFLEATGWRPRIRISVAGGLPYTRYGLVTRWVMQLISKRTGAPTDTSRDWEFTDWDSVDRFGEELAEILGEPNPVQTAGSTGARAPGLGTT